MLIGGAQWAVDQGYGLRADLDRIEEHGQMKHAKPGEVSEQAKKRQRAPSARRVMAPAAV